MRSACTARTTRPRSRRRPERSDAPIVSSKVARGQFDDSVCHGDAFLSRGDPTDRARCETCMMTTCLAAAFGYSRCPECTGTFPTDTSRTAPCQCGGVRFEPAFGIDCGHTPRAGCGDRLAVDVVLHVTTCEHTLDVGVRRIRLGDQVARIGLPCRVDPWKRSVFGRWPIAMNNPVTSTFERSPS